MDINSRDLPFFPAVLSSIREYVSILRIKISSTFSPRLKCLSHHI